MTDTPWNMTDWNADLTQPIQTETTSWESMDSSEPQVITLPIRVKPRRVQSYFFNCESEQNNEGKEAAAKAFLSSGSNKTPSAVKPGKRPDNPSRTRIKPPRDIIKLSDRLFYVLQPPLETLLASNTIEFPFKPFDFQYSGVAFLFPRHSAILADEMGLGKTMQAITSIRMLLRSGYLKNVLLICPKPLVTNWQREFALWAPEVPVSVVSGSQAKRQWHWENNHTPVKIANYELMVRDEQLVTQPDAPYDLVVLDEAQRIKNKSNSTSKVIRNIPRQRSWALTGTPIENSIEDLIGIFEFVSPGAIHNAMSARELRREVKDFVLRRSKDMVLKDLPPKLIRDTELSLTGEQYDSYQQAEKDGVLKLNDLGAEITIKHVFELVLRLKQICNFDPSTGRSSKLELLQSDMEEVAASGRKAIVFSQWVKTLDTLDGHLKEFNPLAYHGRIPSGKRDAILQEFKESPDRHILLMSYGAGSVGLNLQFCRYVYLFDRWWNPAVEDQAINRAHRIGAAGSVTVTRMISAGTIEQRIHDILESKRELFNEILSDNRNPASYGLSKEEIFGLFNLKTPDGTISKVA